jgi:hypothetical protein
MGGKNKIKKMRSLTGTQAARLPKHGQRLKVV